MSKYDYKNDKFLEHYKCDVETDKYRLKIYDRSVLSLVCMGS